VAARSSGCSSSWVLVLARLAGFRNGRWSTPRRSPTPRARWSPQMITRTRIVPPRPTMGRLSCLASRAADATCSAAAGPVWGSAGSYSLPTGPSRRDRRPRRMLAAVSDNGTPFPSRQDRPVAARGSMFRQACVQPGNHRSVEDSMVGQRRSEVPDERARESTTREWCDRHRLSGGDHGLGHGIADREQPQEICRVRGRACATAAGGQRAAGQNRGVARSSDAAGVFWWRQLTKPSLLRPSRRSRSPGVACAG
jgi:hypothetical protein